MYSVNLGGMLFHINNDAYDTLKTYLDTIRKYFPDEENKEIVEEVELRLAELFSERLTDRKQVITIGDVRDAIETIGYPEDFTDSNDSSKNEEKKMSAAKKLYRDPDKRILGGVCAGLAEYFNTEVALIRVIFIIVTLFFATGLLIYIILWLITPEATTMAQKREMRGEKFDFSSFKRRAKSEYENIKNNFNL